MERIYIKNLKDHINQEVSINAWVDVRRDQGKLIFLDLRDRTGKIQGVVLSNNNQAHEVASEIRTEWVVKIRGLVNERPEKAKQDKENGDIELEILDIEVLNEAETIPFGIDGDGKEIEEETRLKYRYIDLRRKRMQENLRKRHQVLQFTRDFFSNNDFLEIETPYITKSTPEGALDYIIPSRIDKGKFYALPQSPQQYKQFLMSAGFENYFQIARCFRDEDTRGDRQPEFTQIDMEMSFVDKEKIMALNEQLLIELVQKIYPEKEIQEIPFPRITYQEAMQKYNSDRPDLRKDKNNPNLLAFCWVIDFPFFEKTDQGKWTFTHNPFSAPQKEYLNDLMEKKNIEKIIADQYDIVLNGSEIGGGSIRSHKSEHLQKIFEIMDYSPERIKENFGHMLTAFQLGTPPHGGLAFGFDRLIMILQNEPNIREVIAFPKTGEGRDPMMKSPSSVSPDQLEELGIKITKP